MIISYNTASVKSAEKSLKKNGKNLHTLGLQYVFILSVKFHGSWLKT